MIKNNQTITISRIAKELPAYLAPMHCEKEPDLKMKSIDRWDENGNVTMNAALQLLAAVNGANQGLTQEFVKRLNGGVRWRKIVNQPG